MTDPTRVEVALGPDWASKFHLTEISQKKLEAALGLFDKEIEKSTNEMLNEHGVLLRTIFISFDEDMKADLAIVGLEDANSPDYKHAYARTLDMVVEKERPQFVIQSAEAWMASVASIEDYDRSVRVSDHPDKVEVVVNTMFCNLYGTALSLSSSRRVYRNKSTGLPEEIAPLKIYETHRKENDRGTLASFVDLLPPIS